MIGERPNQTPANGVEAAAIAYQALELRKRGASYRTIATKLSCSVSTAHGHVTTALAELRERTKTSAEELRELEIQRLDRWEAALQMGLREPEGPNRAKVVATLVKVAESRRKLADANIAETTICERFQIEALDKIGPADWDTVKSELLAAS
jgi:hypothetical protein